MKNLSFLFIVITMLMMSCVGSYQITGDYSRYPMGYYYDDYNGYNGYYGYQYNYYGGNNLNYRRPYYGIPQNGGGNQINQQRGIRPSRNITPNRTTVPNRVVAPSTTPRQNTNGRNRNNR